MIFEDDIANGIAEATGSGNGTGINWIEVYHQNAMKEDEEEEEEKKEQIYENANTSNSKSYHKIEIK